MRSGRGIRKYLTGVPNELADLIVEMMQPQPARRITIENVLRHKRVASVLRWRQAFHIVTLPLLWLLAIVAFLQRTLLLFFTPMRWIESRLFRKIPQSDQDTHLSSSPARLSRPISPCLFSSDDEDVGVHREPVKMKLTFESADDEDGPVAHHTRSH